MKDEMTHPTVAPKFLYKLKCSSTKKLIFGFLSKSNYLDITSWNHLFFTSSRLISVSEEYLKSTIVERIGRNHLLNAKLHFQNHRMKSLESGN